MTKSSGLTRLLLEFQGDTATLPDPLVFDWSLPRSASVNRR
jgi:hypothetical protein